MSESPSLPKALLLSIALVQGLLLFALYKAFDLEVWPSQSPLWAYPLWTLAIAIPMLLLLALERGRERHVFTLAAIFAVVLTLLAIYIGWQAQPHGEFPVSALSLMNSALLSPRYAAFVRWSSRSASNAREKTF